MDKLVEASGNSTATSQPMTANIEVEAHNASKEQSGNIGQQQQSIPFSQQTEAEGTKSKKRK